MEALFDSFDEELHARECSAFTLNLQNFSREEIWLTIFQVNEVKSPLRADSQKQEDELTESLQSSKYGAVLTAVANLFSGHFGAVQVNNMLKQQRASSFF